MGCFKKGLILLFIASSSYSSCLAADSLCDALVCEEGGEIKIVERNTTNLSIGLGMEVPMMSLPIQVRSQTTRIAQPSNTPATNPTVNPTPTDTERESPSFLDRLSATQRNNTPSPSTAPDSSTTLLPQQNTPTINSTNRIGEFIYSDDSEKVQEVQKKMITTTKQAASPLAVTDSPFNNTDDDFDTENPFNSNITSGGSPRNLASINSSSAKSKASAGAANSSSTQKVLESIKDKDTSGIQGKKGSRFKDKRWAKKRRSLKRKFQNKLNKQRLSLNNSSKPDFQARLRRGLASMKQMSDPNVFLFHSMCSLYDSFEKNNDINLGKTECPKK